MNSPHAIEPIQQTHDQAELAAVRLDTAFYRVGLDRRNENHECRILDSEASAEPLNEEWTEVDVTLKVRVRVPSYPDPRDVGIDVLSALRVLTVDCETKLIGGTDG
jgi:hypothetical protein